MIEKRDRTQKV